MKKSIRGMVVIVVWFSFVCLPVYSQVGSIVKTVGKNVAEESMEKAFKREMKNYGRHSVEQSVVNHAFKKEVREKMMEHFGKEGIESFFEYGNKKVMPKVSRTRFSLAKKRMDKSEYKKALRGNNAEKKSLETVSKTNIGLYRNVKIIARKEGDEALNYLMQKHPDVYNLIKKEMMGNGGPLQDPYWNKFVCEIGDKGELIIRNTRPEASNTAILIKGNTIKAYSGCAQDAVQQSPNIFLDYLLPNKTYVIDDGKYVFEVDGLKRTTFGKAVYTKDMAMKTNLDSGRRNYVQQFKQGRGTDVDDAGHIFQRNKGGINELINLVPMDNAWQRSGGAWRTLEKQEEDIIETALAANKVVTSTRRLLYEGNSLRPSKILVETFVDGKKVLSKILDCP